MAPIVQQSATPNVAATDAAHGLIDAVAEAIGHHPVSGVTIPLHEPEFGPNERAYVLDAIDSTFVSSVGAYVERFEAMLADFCGAKRAVAVVNGTAALHVALLAAGVDTDDEVLMPALTFVATAAAARYLGAVPHFVDVDAGRIGLCPRALAGRLEAVAERRSGRVVNRMTGRRIAAVVPMHAFGHPVDLKGIVAVAQEWGLAVIEDAAEALGSRVGDLPVGAGSRLAIMSFNGNKIITTGGGGAILTDDDELGRRLKHLTTTAKVPHRWAFVHDDVGFNYRLPNLNAALGCAQIERLPDFVARKRTLAARYETALSKLSEATFVPEPSGTTSNYWLVCALLVPGLAPHRDAILAVLNDAGIGARPVWTLLHRLAPYADCPRGDLSVSEDLEARLINLPSSARFGGTR